MMILDQIQEAMSLNASGDYASGVYANVDKRCRKMSRFWLDLSKDGQYALAVQVEDLKAKRMFVPTIREALELIFSLRQRRTDVLERLFPWIASHYQSAGQGDMNARLAALEAQIASLRTTSAAAQPGPRALSVPPLPMPVEDDEDSDLLNVVKAKSSGVSAQNFLNSAFSLVQ
jgi:hypothetical protein